LEGRHRVVAYDQRGHGESSKPSAGYGFNEVAADAAEVIRRLRLRRPLVVGHSWGGGVALEVCVANRRLVAGAVLLDGGFLSMREKIDWPTARELLRPPDIDGMHVDDFLRGWTGATGLPLTDGLAAVARSLVHVGPDGRIRRRLSVPKHMRILRAIWEHDVERALSSVRVPTLVLAARSPVAHPREAAFMQAKREAAARVRKMGAPVRFAWIDGIHDLPLERPAAVSSRIGSFAEDVGRMEP
jgi:pimeloyl-ACP methyl ester carboxylesterase